MPEILDFILHLDRHLLDLVAHYGPWIYGLLFGIVFAETGLVVTPFLPGDSLLFAAGALAEIGVLNLPLTAVLLFVAAVAGDAVNYAIGRRAGPRMFSATDQTAGCIACSTASISRARMCSSSATAARPSCSDGSCRSCGRSSRSSPARPDVAVGVRLLQLHGRDAWVGICFGGGVLFGNIPIVKNNFSLVTIGIVFVSVLPIVVEWLRHRNQQRQQPAA